MATKTKPVQLDPDLHSKIKAIAKSQRRTLGGMVELILSQFIARHSRKS